MVSVADPERVLLYFPIAGIFRGKREVIYDELRGLVNESLNTALPTTLGKGLSESGLLSHSP